MISVRSLSSSRFVQREALKLFIQRQKCGVVPAHIASIKCYGTSKITEKNYKKLLSEQLEKFKGLSTIPSRVYSVSAPSLKEADDYRSDHSITVIGEDIPDPIQKIDDEVFPDYIQNFLKKEGIEKPSIIQAQGWPIAMSGRNLVGIAQTGTGKTLAYLLPAVLHIKAQEMRRGSGPVVLVLAPTRELARQIQQVANKFVRGLGIRTGCVYGGASRNQQLNELRQGTDILIATPGRLIDFLQAKTTNLDFCSYLVLDEADRMLDMGFEPQIREIVDQIQGKRQVLMWSATWPKEVQALARDYLEDYVQVNVGSVDLSANHNITQVVHICEEKEKSKKLNEIIKGIMDEECGKILIFTNMKRTVEDVEHRLRISGWPAVGTHGGKTQRQRDSIIYQFKHGKAKILVASDVAARGLDVDNITHVINYDYPMNSEDYVHRIGRTGRSGAKGTAHSLLTDENARQAKELIAIMEEANQEIPLELRALANEYDASRAPPPPKRNYKNNYFSKNQHGNQYGGKRSGGYGQRDNFGQRRSDRYDY